MKITDVYLEQYTKCPLRVPANWYHPNEFLEPEIVASMETAKWFLARCFDRSIPSLHQTQVEFEKELRAIDKGLPIPPRICAGLSKRMVELSRSYRVVQPISPFSLTISGTELTGSYGVLSTRHREPELFVIKLVPKPEESFRYPSIDLLAGWLHFITQNDSKAGIGTIAVLSKHQSFKSAIIESQARLFIQNAISLLHSDYKFPIPGPYCRNCPTFGCLSVVERDD